MLRSARRHHPEPRRHVGLPAARARRSPILSGENPLDLCQNGASRMHLRRIDCGASGRQTPVAAYFARRTHRRRLASAPKAVAEIGFGYLAGAVRFLRGRYGGRGVSQCSTRSRRSGFCPDVEPVTEVGVAGRRAGGHLQHPAQRIYDPAIRLLLRSFRALRFGLESRLLLRPGARISHQDDGCVFARRDRRSLCRRHAGARRRPGRHGASSSKRPSAGDCCRRAGSPSSASRANCPPSSSATICRNRAWRSSARPRLARRRRISRRRSRARRRDGARAAPRRHLDRGSMVADARSSKHASTRSCARRPKFISGPEAILDRFSEAEVAQARADLQPQSDAPSAVAAAAYRKTRLRYDARGDRRSSCWRRCSPSWRC